MFTQRGRCLFAGAVAAGASLLSFAARPVTADVLVPKFSVPAFFGQANTTYQEWEGYTSPAGPNPATGAANPNGAPNWLDTSAATDGTFLIGSSPASAGAPGGHIYSPTGLSHPEVFVPIANLGPNATTTIVLQVETQGNEIDPNSFAVTLTGHANIAPTSTTVSQSTISQGVQDDWTVTWSGLAGNVTGYTIDYAAGGTSVSNVATRVDTVSAVPEPASVGVLGVGLLGLVHRRRQRIPA